MRCIYAAAAFFLPLALAAGDFTVGVGKDETTGKKGLGFDPSSINPGVGDTIVFEFRSGKHSVVQSSFENPCTSSGAFNSGVQTVDDSLSVDAPGLPTVRLLVNDTQPLWFFDDAGGRCKEGAVLSVNPSLTQTAAAFKENAAKATVDTKPSDPPANSDSGSSKSGSQTQSAPPNETSKTTGGAERVAVGGAYGLAVLALWALL